VAEGIGWVGTWRHKIDPVHEAAQVIREAGLRVSSLCRGGFFPASTASERRKRVEDNLRALDEAAALDAGLLVLVCGPAPDRDLDTARAMVADGVDRLSITRRRAGFGWELNRCIHVCRGTLGRGHFEAANDMASQFDAAIVGVVVMCITSGGIRRYM